MQRRQRHVKGSNVIDLVKLIKDLQKRGTLLSFGAAAEALVAERLLSSAWYAFEPFVELLEAVNTAILRSEEGRALELGAAGGASALRGPARLYLHPDNPRESVFAMRHAWRARHDFGELTATIEDSSIRFTFADYDDIGMVHALTTAGWGVAAARAAGSVRASAHVIARPWRGEGSFCYRISY